MCNIYAAPRPIFYSNVSNVCYDNHTLMIRFRWTTAAFKAWISNCIYIEMCLSKPTLTQGMYAWWRHQIEAFSALLAFCAGKSRVTGEFPSQRSVTRSFDVFFDLRPNKRLSKGPRRRWSEMPLRPSWRHRNGKITSHIDFGCTYLSRP